jgi:hypothetical protein
MKKAKRLLPKLTNAERHKRFVEMAREVEASEDPKDFDRAFGKVVKHGESPAHPSGKRASS